MIKRRAVARLVNGKRKFEYLVHFKDWEIYDATW